MNSAPSACCAISERKPEQSTKMSPSMRSPPSQSNAATLPFAANSRLSRMRARSDEMFRSTMSKDLSWSNCCSWKSLVRGDSAEWAAPMPPCGPSSGLAADRDLAVGSGDLPSPSLGGLPAGVAAVGAAISSRVTAIHDTERASAGHGQGQRQRQRGCVRERADRNQGAGVTMKPRRR